MYRVIYISLMNISNRLSEVDTKGCILLGVQFGKLGSENAILASRVAVKRFMGLMAGSTDSELLVVDAYGGGRVH